MRPKRCKLSAEQHGRVMIALKERAKALGVCGVRHQADLFGTSPTTFRRWLSGRIELTEIQAHTLLKPAGLTLRGVLRVKPTETVQSLPASLSWAWSFGRMLTSLQPLPVSLQTVMSSGPGTLAWVLRGGDISVHLTESPTGDLWAQLLYRDTMVAEAAPSPDVVGEFTRCVESKKARARSTRRRKSGTASLSGLRNRLRALHAGV